VVRYGFLVFAALLLTCVALLRPPEYDEAYSVFLTAGEARPAWPAGVFTSAAVQPDFTGSASLGGVARDLRVGDVHPPLYFWVLTLWRRVFGPGWITARLLSVAFSLASLLLLARIAAGETIPVLPTLAITLLSYGFAYTGTVARGFALAQFFSLLGVMLARRERGLPAGLAFGAASFTNYLAIFPGLAVLAWAVYQRAWRQAVGLACGLALFVPADAWFFLAQRNTRLGQFAVFSLGPALRLLAKDTGAALFGGLPLYAGHAGWLVTIALFTLALACLRKIWRRHDAFFTLCALATPLGLLALGLIFNNTPIEIRYCAFCLPFVALLLAGALPRLLLTALLAVQGAAIIGLAVAPATMQPQGLAARQAAAFHSLTLVPFGNDGVGIPGPFIAAAPPNMRIMLLRTGVPPDIASAPRVALAVITADSASHQQITATETWLAAHPCWHLQIRTNLVALWANRCAHQNP
jgi:hypothetical protein